MPPAAPWSLTAPPRRVAWSAAGLIALLLVAAWTIPPELDWGRFRSRIAAIAATRLGRPVVIGGEIRLRLLPHAVLTASDVTLPDQGDGISGQVAALRLQVATLPLLTGRIVLRDLVLGAPVLRLPMALPHGLPDTIAHPSHPLAPPAFAARIENGVLRIGQTEISGITAAIHGGPDTPPGVAAGVQEVLSPDAAPVAAFGAEGFAAAGGRIWRFTAALGVPNADGVSPVDLSVHGQGVVAETGGTLQGTLADGVVQGRLRAGGPNLALLMPASPLAWHAEAPFVATAQQVESAAISLSLGGAPAEGALTLRLATPARLDGRLHAAALDLDGWAALLGTGLRLPAQSAAGLLPLRIALSADAAKLLDGALHDLRATLVLDGTGLGFDHTQATLPGGAVLSAPSTRLEAAAARTNAPALSGTATLAAPDLRATLAWLRPLAPALADAVPAGTLGQTTLTGAATLGADGLSVTALAGRIDGTPVSGSLIIHPGTRPALALTLGMDTLQLDPWLAGIVPGQDLATFGHGFAATDTTLHITAAHAVWHDLKLTACALDARTGSGGLTVDQAQANLAGAHLSSAGTVATDGRLTGATLSVATQDLAPLPPLLPQPFRRVPGLWHGPATLRLAADGPPDALALQLRADAGDLVLEAEAFRNSRDGSATATLTLRHPGAPRLAAAIGLPGGIDAAIAWLDTGSLAFRAHLQATPFHLAVQDFDLDAADLRLSGHLDATWTTATPTLTGTLAAEHLPLPPWPTLQPLLTQAAGWTTDLHITSGLVSLANTQFATDATANLATVGGTLLVSGLSATAGGGHLTGELAANLPATTYAARLSLTDARITAPLTAWPIDLDKGSADITADLAASGSNWTALRGQAATTLRDVRLTGLDLASPRAALTAGPSPGLAGTVDATIDAGRVTLTPAQLTSPDGALAITGSADANGGTVNLRLATSGGSVVDMNGAHVILETAAKKPVRRRKK